MEPPPVEPAAAASADAGARKGTLSTAHPPSAAAAALEAAITNGQPPVHHQWRVASEEVSYKRYLAVYNRTVHFTAEEGQTRRIDFDVVGHPSAQFQYSIVFPFHPYTDGRPGGEVTLIQEYAQGPNQMVLGLPAGAFDSRRHADQLECAQQELSEEACLAGGRWVPLLEEGHPGIAEVKWCANRMQPFLVIDPQPDAAPLSRDEEEHTIQVLRLPLDRVEALAASGQMLLPSVTTVFLATRWLRQAGLA